MLVQNFIDYLYDKANVNLVKTFIYLSLFYVLFNSHPVFLYIYSSLYSSTILNSFITSLIIKYFLFVFIFLVWIFLLLITLRISDEKFQFCEIFTSVLTGFAPFLLLSWLFSWYWLFSGVRDFIWIFLHGSRFLLLAYSLYLTTIIFEKKLNLNKRRVTLAIILPSVIYLALVIFLNINSVNYLQYSGFRDVYPFYQQLIFP